ncbi:MAG: hypothetical protein LBC59_07870 [Chitinispirillales bacterium]|jgi:uncharacterized protein (TIGR02145 family)|nr:hypothetical protein [Chitinispirillales bacterium]
MNMFTLLHKRTLLLTTAALSTAIASICLPGCKNSGSGTHIDERDGKKYETAAIGGQKSGYGRLIDKRDGQKYLTTAIGGQIWMAENLDYATSNGGSWCFNDSADNCNKYGRLYDWETALTICPAGWHLPSVEEWDNLMLAVGGERTTGYNGKIMWYGADKKLKAKIGWNDYFDRYTRSKDKIGNGTDNYGFAALPGGERNPDEYRSDNYCRFHGAGNYSLWWTATEHQQGYAYARQIQHYNDYVDGGVFNMDAGFSVRCILDDSGGKPSDLVRLTEEKEKRQKEARRRIEENSTYFIDSRDKRKYRAVKIGTRRWMAENLNYKPLSGNSWCYNNDPSYCDKYGRLYDWETARTVCPSGWHLPFGRTWNNMVITAGGDQLGIDKLKAISGWNRHFNGTDDYGFSALPGGSFAYDNFDDAGWRSYWWTASEKEDAEAYRMEVWGGIDNHKKSSGLSVRCVEHENPYTVKISSIGEGVKGGGTFERGDTIFLTAGTAIGLQFKNWTSKGGNVSFADANSPITTFTMPASNVTVTANFDKIVVQLGTFTDERDGKTYRTTTIGGNTWMAENLNYQTDNSWCYDNKNSNCDKYGRLYNWETARTACPSGWHLPSREEWGDLAKIAGGADSYGERGAAGKKLKAKKGWNDGGNGTDDYGFSALPGGGYYYGGFQYIGDRGEWRTVSTSGASVSYVRVMGNNHDYIREDDVNDNNMVSVRCVLGDDNDDDDDD